MGFENRDYYRDSSEYDDHRGSDSDLTASIVGRILIINIIVYVAQILFVTPGGAVSHLETWLAMDPVKVLQGQAWRLLTYAFLHDRFSFWHILLNLYFLWILGRELERMYGSREFLRFYLAGALIGGVVQLLFQNSLHDRALTMGSSGAVMAVFMLFVMHFPRHIFMIFLILPVEARWLLVFDLIMEVHPVLLQLSGVARGGNIAHAAHLGGFMFGYFYYRGRWRLTNWSDFSLGSLSPQRWLKWWRRPRLRVVRDDSRAPRDSSTSDGERVDALLQKILEQGEASLTDAERKFLNDASRRLRERKNGQ